MLAQEKFLYTHFLLISDVKILLAKNLDILNRHTKYLLIIQYHSWCTYNEQSIFTWIGMSGFVKDGELLVFACMVVKTLKLIRKLRTVGLSCMLHIQYNNFALFNQAHFFYGAVFANTIAFDLTPC